MSINLEMRQVLLAKQLLMEAERVGARGTELGHGLAVSLAQDCVEMLLGAIAKAWNLGLKPRTDFDDLVQAIDTAAQERQHQALPERQRLRDLNRARVNFKHFGQVPRSDASARYVSYASEFLYAACSRLLGIDAAAVSLSDLVIDDRIREQLKAAESAFHEGAFRDALSAAALAVHHLNEQFDSYFPQCKIGGASSQVAPGVDALAAYVNALRAAMIVSQLGLDQRLFWAFHAHAPIVNMSRTGSVQFVHGRAFPESRDGAELCVGFARDLAIAVQEGLGSLATPKVQ